MLMHGNTLNIYISNFIHSNATTLRLYIHISEYILTTPFYTLYKLYYQAGI